MNLQQRKFLSAVQLHAARQTWGHTVERAASAAARNRQREKLLRSVAFRKFERGKWGRW